MTTNVPLPKVYGFKMPDTVMSGVFVSVTLCFPNELEYRAAFNGQINMLGKWFQWEHTQADYQDIPSKNREVAELWVDVLASAVWEEGCMAFCERMIECLTTDTDVQAALADLIATNPLIRQSLQTLIDNGSVITTPTIPIVETADLDALFGAVTFLVDTMNDANIDLYEALEASTNNRESGQIMFAAVPVMETLPLDEVSEYVDFLASSVAENYASQYTTTPETGMRDRIRCGLFCLARDNDNSLNWDLIANYFWEQISFTTPNLGVALQEFIEFVITGSWSGEEIVYLSFGNIAAALSTAQKFSGMTFPSLSAIMQLGLNNPDPDWEILCLDCPPVDCDVYDFTLSDHGFTPLLSGYAVYVAGEGWARGTGDNVGRCGIQGAIGNYTSIEFEYNEVADNPTSIAGLIEYPYPPYTELTGFVNTTGQTTFTLTYTSSTGGAAFDLGTVVSGSAGYPIPSTWRLTKITVCR